MSDAPPLMTHFPDRQKKRAIGPWLLLGIVIFLHGSTLWSSETLLLGQGREDLESQFLPWLTWAFGEVGRGKLPWFSPWAFGGYPFIANWQSAVFYPVNWLHLVLPTGLAINLFLSLHIYLAGLFTWLFARGRGISDLPAALTGATFMLAGPTYAHLYAGHMTWVSTVAWFPLMLWAIDRICGSVWEWPVRPGLVLAMAVGMQWLAGYPQPAYISLICAAMFAAHELAFNGNGLIRKSVTGIGAVLLGLAIAWVQIGPGLALGPETYRSGGLPLELAGTYSLPKLNLWLALSPESLGDMARAREGYGYLGDWLQWEVWPFLGLTVLCLSASRLLINPAKAVLAWLAIVLLTGVAMGPGHFPFDFLFHYMPGMDRFRVPGRWMMPVPLVAGILGARTLDAMLLKEAIGRWKLILPWVIVLIPLGTWGIAGAAHVGWAIGEWDRTLRQLSHGGKSFLQESSLTPDRVADLLRFSARRALEGAILAVIALAIFLWPYPVHDLRKRGRWITWLALFELVLFASRITANFSYRAEEPASWERAITAAAPGSRAVIRDNTWQNRGADLGVAGVWGYDPVVLRRTAEVMAVSQGDPPEHASQDSFHGKYTALLGKLWNIGLVLEIDRNRQLATAAKVDDGFGQAWFASDVHELTDRAGRLQWLQNPGTDLRNSVAVETELRLSAGGPITGRGESKIEPVLGLEKFGQAATGASGYRLTAGSPGVVVLSMAYSRGWEYRLTSLDGQSASWWYPVIPADHALIGVPVPAAGRYLVEVTYRPQTMGGPWVTTFAASLAIALAASYRKGR